MIKRDENLRLLAGLPIHVNGVGDIYTKTLKEIAEIGESKYNQFLSILTVDIKDLDVDEESKQKLEEDNINTFIILLSQCKNDQSGEFKEMVENALSFFIGQEVVLILNAGVFYVGDKERLQTIENLDNECLLTNDNYEEFKRILLSQNCIKEKKEKYKPANKKAKRIAEKLKQSKEVINEQKSKSGEKLDLYDLVSAFSAYSNSVNIIDVWDLTFYQFNDQFQRTQLIEDYEISIQSLLHGADKNKVEIKHFIRKMD